MIRNPSWRSSVFICCVIAAAVLLLTPSRQRHAISQMVSSGAKDQPPRRLPRGMKAPVVDFRDIAAHAGLSAVVISGEPEQTTVVENTGTGVAIFDYDNDGLPDVFIVQGDRLNSGSATLTPHLYHNLGGLRFEDVTEKAGIGHTGWGQGVCAGDPDNDGKVDLFLTQWGHNVFLHNTGNGTFRDETRTRLGLTRLPLEHWMCIHRLRPRWLARSGRGPLYRLQRPAIPSVARTQWLQMEKHCCTLRTAGPQGRNRDAVPQ